MKHRIAMKSTPLPLLVLVALLLLGACSSGSLEVQAGTQPVTDVALDQKQNETKDSPAALDTPPEDVNAVDVAAADVPALEVTALGADAPQRLSLRSVGDSTGQTILPGARPVAGETWDGTVALTTVIDFEGMPGLTIPRFEMDTSVVVTAVNDDGSWTMASTYGDVRVTNGDTFSAAEVTQLESTMEELKNLTITATVDKYGVVSNTNVEGLENLSPELAAQMDVNEQLENMTTTVPTVEVGVGASWTDTNTSEVNGVGATTTIVYTITEISGDTYTMDFTTNIDMDGEVVENGQTVSMFGTLSGEGSVTMDINEPAPTTMISNITGELDLEAAGEQLTMAMTVEAQILGS